MSENVTPAPALTDEQIDQRTQAIRYDWLRARAEGRDRDAQVAKFNAWLADVEGRAERRERGRIVGELSALTAGIYSDDVFPPLSPTDWEAIRAAIESAGYTPGRVAGNLMRSGIRVAATEIKEATDEH